MEFVPFEIAKKLKEKGFTCKYPFAMYNELGSYCPLTTSSDYVTSESGYKYRCYYDYNDFDENDFIAPTISQVLKWLEDKKKIFLTVDIEPMGFFFIINYDILTNDNGEYEFNIYNSTNTYPSSIESAIEGIEYVLDNLI